MSFGPVAGAIAGPGTWGATASLHVARSSQTATRLFGGEVLVVGGVQAGQALASAELYDPSSRTWTATAPLAAARTSHTATILPDGRVVVVAGFGSGGKPLASSEVYDPATGTWSAGGTLITARASHTATLLSSGRILVAGGIGPDGSPLASAELYNPTSGKWTATGSMSTPRSLHTATLLADGKVLVAGGVGADGRPLASAELYNPAGGTWSPTASMSTARSAHTATALGDQVSGGADPRVLVAGGTGGDGSRQASAELYDESSGTWTGTGALAAGRSAHSATLLPNGFVLVVGGTASGSLPGVSAELYDPRTGHWTLTGQLPGNGRAAHTATVLLNGWVLVAGGADAAGASVASSELYDPDLGSRWQMTGSLEVARSAHTATLLPDGDVLVAGGLRTTTAVSPPRMIDPLASAELYHPKSGKWTLTGSLGQARAFQTATLLKGSRSQCGSNCNKVLVAGGVTADATGRAQTTASVELYDPVRGTWSATGSMTTPRALHSATLLPSGKVLVVGGAGPGGAEPRNANQLASAELYDPASGTWTATGSLTGTTTPPATNTPRGARLGHLAILLNTGHCGSNCGKVLVAGGVGGVGTGPALSSAELYDPATGTFRATADMDQSRQGLSGALLPSGKVMVVGGFHDPFGTSPPNLNTAEMYDPASERWSPAGSLAARRFAQTTTLLSNGDVLVAGGAGGGNAPGTTNEAGPGLFSSELFDPATAAWSRTSFLFVGRVYHTATLLPSGPASVCGHNCGKVLVAGGNAELIGNFPPYFNLLSPLSSAELYTPPAPVLSKLRIVPRAFFATRRARNGRGGARSRRTRRVGARVSYTLNARASVRFRVERPAAGRVVGGRCVAARKSNHKRRRCTRYIRLRGNFRRTGKPGRNRFHFGGRLNGRSLAPGRYRLLATPAASSTVGTTVRTPFRIRP